MNNYYGDTLTHYVALLADKLRSGKITEERFYDLTDKLMEWEALAVKRGVI